MRGSLRVHRRTRRVELPAQRFVHRGRGGPGRTIRGAHQLARKQARRTRHRARLQAPRCGVAPFRGWFIAWHSIGGLAAPLENASSRFGDVAPLSDPVRRVGAHHARAPDLLRPPAKRRHAALHGPQDAALRPTSRIHLFSSGGGRCPFGAGLSCFAPSPGRAGARPCRASIPIAGAPPASRRFAGRPLRG